MFGLPQLLKNILGTFEPTFGRFLAFTFIIGLLAFLGGLALTLWPRASLTPMSSELIKWGLQVWLVGGISVAATLMTSQWNRERAAKEKEDEVARVQREKLADQDRQQRLAREAQRQQFHQDLNDAYTELKRCRRLLKAQAITTPDPAGAPAVLLAPYEAQMLVLEGVQLTFERLIKKLLIGSKQPLFLHSFSIGRDLRTMEKWLRSICREYERQRRQFSSPHLPVAQFPELQKFLTSADPDTKAGFTAYDTALATVLVQLYTHAQP